MYTARLKYLRIGVAALSAFLASVVPLRADSKDYKEVGQVISVTADHGYVYTIETSDKIYQLLCTARMFQISPPECKIAGKAIAVNDTVHFRCDGDAAYIPNSENGEDKLLVLSTELKMLASLPASTGPSAGEPGTVRGVGMQIGISQHSGFPGSSRTTGPVLATPVTGGPPVEVIPAGPTSGGVITGTPVTGGPPITAIPVAPTAAATDSKLGVPVWIHFLRLQTSGRVYDLACPWKSCSLKSGTINLGDMLTIRIDKKYAYLSLPVPGSKSEQKFQILAVRDVDDLPPIPPH